jgi:hypothetical protein
VPLYIAQAEGESYEDAIKRAKFDTVLEALQTLKEMDEAFADYLKEMVQPAKRAKGGSDWRVTDHIQFIAPKVLLEKLTEAIKLECIDRLIPNWEHMHAQLVAFKEANGHCNVLVESGPLGTWCHSQRQYRKRGILSQERISRLDAIGFIWEPFGAAWNEMYAEAVDFKKVHGHLNAPYKRKLWGWLIHQREKRKRSALSQERINLLDAIGFCWDTIDEAWDKMYAKLVDFKGANGHCRIPASDEPLEKWCDKQRRRRKEGRLTPDQIARLDTIGFCWDLSEAAWNGMYIVLATFQKNNGHCNVPNDHVASGWCDTQRQCRRNGKMIQERIDRLDTIGFCWDPFKEIWHKAYGELVAFYKVNGHCNVPCGTSLRAWCTTQRVCRKSGKMDQGRIDLLDAIEFTWDPRQKMRDNWHVMYAELVTFNKANGHCNVLSTDGPLGAWCARQREKRRGSRPGKLSQERIAQLDALRFCWQPRLRTVDPAPVAAPVSVESA